MSFSSEKQQQLATNVDATVGKPRARWSSKLAFWFTALGAAVGFGNVWRFPALAANYGGGAFFIPYVLALFLIGIPLLILEIGLGQFYQTGDVGVFGSFHRRWKGVGVISVALAYMLVTYYAVLIAWVINGFFDTFRDEAPWDKKDVTGDEATGYFVLEVIGAKTLGTDGRPTRLVTANAFYALLTWFLIWVCLAGGPAITGRITYFTMGFPIVALIIFFAKAVSLEGSGDGIKQYIGQWDLDVLTEQPDVWSTAVSQVFFSLSITFGTMTALGSYNQRDDPAVMHSFVIGIVDGTFSFMAGFAVFAALGHLAHLQNVEVTSIKNSGFSLLFGTYPVVFGKLAGGMHWVRLCFFFMFTLGIDSGFGLLEGALTAAADTVYLSRFTKWQLSGVLCLIGFCFSLIYTTDAGLNFLDATDYYINFVMILVGFFETFAAGWIYGMDAQIELFGPGAVYAYMFANFGAIVAASFLWFFLPENAVLGGFLALLGIYAAGVGLAAVFLARARAGLPVELQPWPKMIWELSFGNVMDLRAQLATTLGFLPHTWAVLIKQFIPHVLLVLFINLAQAKDATTGKAVFGSYGVYVQWPFQMVGYGSVVFAAFLFFLGLIFPDLYNGLSLVDDTMVLRPVRKGQKQPATTATTTKDLPETVRVWVVVVLLLLLLLPTATTSKAEKAFESEVFG